MLRVNLGLVVSSHQTQPSALELARQQLQEKLIGKCLGVGGQLAEACQSLASARLFNVPKRL